jgi:site-specific recombinase XerD
MALKKAGINRIIRPYDLHHHFVTAALAAGVDAKSVADVVGSNPSTIIKHYQHVTTQQHVRVVTHIPTLGRPAAGDGDTKYTQN